MNRRRLAALFLVALAVSLSAVPPLSTPHEAAAGDLRGLEGRLLPGVGLDAERPASASDGVRAIGAGDVHARGITGSNVTVGVIGAGFDAGDRSIREAVADRRGFGGAPAGDEATRHGTAVAAVVAETAPNATLSLAAVGSRPDPETYRRAVAWLERRGADVIVDSSSYFPVSAADRTRLSAVAAAAVDDGTVFVTSAGNYGRRHWAGRADGDGWVTFAEETEANPLGDGPIAGRVSLRLYWEGSADYDLYLYRRTPGRADPVVAKSVRRQDGGNEAAEAIDATLPRGRYYVGVRAADGATAPARLDLFAARHRLAHGSAAAALTAPATAEGVVAVGATNATSGRPLPYSSTGPGVDLYAPGAAGVAVDARFRGTSAAAPYVAGTAALVLASNSDLSPAAVERTMERTAVRSGGVRRVNASAAVTAARDAGPTAAPTP